MTDAVQFPGTEGLNSKVRVDFRRAAWVKGRQRCTCACRFDGRDELYSC